MRHPVLLLLALPMTLAAAPGEIYQWTDAEGNLYFGDHPPTQAEPERLEHLESDPNAPPPPPVKTPRFRYEPPKRRTGGGVVGIAKRKAREKRGRAFELKLDELRDRMRSGYTLSQGEALRKRERAYKDGVFENCR